MLACNSFPGVLGTHLVDPSDGHMFAQITDGNCVARCLRRISVVARSLLR